MASPEAEALRGQFSTVRRGIDGSVTLADQRAASEHFGDLATEPDGVEFIRSEFAGVDVLVATPAGAVSGRAVQYLHGGGYQVCSVDSHRKLTGHIARAAGVTVVSVAYRLAPEHPHPAPVTDSVAVYRALLAGGFRPAHLALAGDSAGGGLAVATALALRADALPLPAAIAALSGWFDLECTGESIHSRADTDLSASPRYLHILRDDFLAGGDPQDPLASPLHGDVAGLPPLYLQVGDEEILLDDSTRLAARARAAGVEVTLDVYPEMQHVFQKAVGRIPEADDAVRRIGAFLRRHLDVPAGDAYGVVS